MSPNDETQNQPSRRGLRRRDAFVAMGTLGLGGVLGATRLGSAIADAEAAAASCVLTPEVTRGRTGSRTA